MSAVTLNARPTRDFDAKLQHTQSLLRTVVAEHPRAASDAGPVVAQASTLGAEDMVISHLPGGQSATVAEVLDHARAVAEVPAGRSAGIVLDRELDVSRGDWLLDGGAEGDIFQPTRELEGTITWLDDERLVPGRIYWALHGHRWIKARVERVHHQLDVHTLAEEPASTLGANAIGRVALSLHEPIAALPYRRSRALGSLVLVDTATHRTAAAVLLV